MNYPISQIHPSDETQQELSEAFNSQNLLGISYFIRGFISWKFAKIQQNHYSALSLTSCSGDNWAKKFILALISFSQNIWKFRCDLVASSTSASYEQSTRNECETLILTLRQNPTSLPTSYRFLLQKKPEFTKTATLRSLQSWLTRLKLELQQAKSGSKTASMDIRNWFPNVHSTPSQPSLASNNTNTAFTQADSDYDSDDTETAFFRDFPDETPYTNHWIPRTITTLRTLPSRITTLRQQLISDFSSTEHNFSPSDARQPVSRRTSM